MRLLDVSVAGGDDAVELCDAGESGDANKPNAILGDKGEPGDVVGDVGTSGDVGDIGVAGETNDSGGAGAAEDTNAAFGICTDVVGYAGFGASEIRDTTWDVGDVVGDIGEDVARGDTGTV